MLKAGVNEDNVSEFASESLMVCATVLRGEEKYGNLQPEQILSELLLLPSDNQTQRS